jgi:methyl-accepting chemotaxis protein
MDRVTQQNAALVEEAAAAAAAMQEQADDLSQVVGTFRLEPNEGVMRASARLAPSTSSSSRLALANAA